MKASRTCLILSGLLWSLLPVSLPADESPDPSEISKVHGGAAVQIGAQDAALPVKLAKTGRFIVNVLDTDSDAVEKTRSALRTQNLYGVASAETLEDFSHLPYTENLINLVIVTEPLAKTEEILRVMVPDGTIIYTKPGAESVATLEAKGFIHIEEIEVSADEKWLVARKPWPDNMGRWTHSRHDANGNAVSPDTAVGEPKRIRWIAAHSGDEVEGMVSDDGRNFYGQSLARDSFNGLRLWHRDLTQAEDKMDPASFVMKPLHRDLARPVATEKFLFAVAFPTRNLVAIDSATGEIVRSFPEITLHDKNLRNLNKNQKNWLGRPLFGCENFEKHQKAAIQSR